MYKYVYLNYLMLNVDNGFWQFQEKGVVIDIKNIVEVSVIIAGFTAANSPKNFRLKD